MLFRPDLNVIVSRLVSQWECHLTSVVQLSRDNVLVRYY